VPKKERRVDPLVRMPAASGQPAREDRPPTWVADLRRTDDTTVSQKVDACRLRLPPTTGLRTLHPKPLLLSEVAGRGARQAKRGKVGKAD
jgi:hypothetical protein